MSNDNALATLPEVYEEACLCARQEDWPRLYSLISWEKLLTMFQALQDKLQIGASGQFAEVVQLKALSTFMDIRQRPQNRSDAIQDLTYILHGDFCVVERGMILVRTGQLHFSLGEFSRATARFNEAVRLLGASTDGGVASLLLGASYIMDGQDRGEAAPYLKSALKTFKGYRRIDRPTADLYRHYAHRWLMRLASQERQGLIMLWHTYKCWRTAPADARARTTDCWPLYIFRFGPE